MASRKDSIQQQKMARCKSKVTTPAKWMRLPKCTSVQVIRRNLRVTRILLTVMDNLLLSWSARGHACRCVRSWVFPVRTTFLPSSSTSTIEGCTPGCTSASCAVNTTRSLRRKARLLTCHQAQTCGSRAQPRAQLPALLTLLVKITVRWCTERSVRR